MCVLSGMQFMWCTLAIMQVLSTEIGFYILVAFCILNNLDLHSRAIRKPRLLQYKYIKKVSGVSMKNMDCANICL